MSVTTNIVSVSSCGRCRYRRQRHRPLPEAALRPRGPGGRVWERRGGRPPRHCHSQSPRLRVRGFHHTLPQPSHAGVCQTTRCVLTCTRTHTDTHMLFPSCQCLHCTCPRRKMGYVCYNESLWYTNHIHWYIRTCTQLEQILFFWNYSFSYS